MNTPHSKFQRPRQVRKLGRQLPYVTVIDTGLGIAIQNALAGISMRLRGIEDAPFAPLDHPDLPDYLSFLGDLLANELSDRSF